jgi:mechanosensitive ion channel-like protein
MDLQAAVLEPGKAFDARMAAHLPNTLAAILIVVVGWVMAKSARSLVFRFLLAASWASVPSSTTWPSKSH